MSKPVIIRRCHIHQTNNRQAIVQIPLREVINAGINVGSDGHIIRVEIYFEDGKPASIFDSIENEMKVRIKEFKWDHRLEISIGDWYTSREVFSSDGYSKEVSLHIDEFIEELFDYYRGCLERNEENIGPFTFKPNKPAKYGPTFALVRFIQDKTGWRGTRIYWGANLV